MREDSKKRRLQVNAQRQTHQEYLLFIWSLRS